jgi:phosphate acetyltransferase
MIDIIKVAKEKAKKKLRTIILTDDHETAVDGAKLAEKEKLAKVIIVSEKKIKGVQTINPKTYTDSDKLAEELYESRKHKGMSLEEAKKLAKDQVYFGLLMLKTGKVDGEIGGTMHNSAEHMGPAFRVIGKRKDVLTVSGIFTIYVKDRMWICSDTDFNIYPNAEELAQIAINAANFAKSFGIKPKVAMLSHSTKGSSKDDYIDKILEAIKIVKKKMPSLIIDGEFQLDTAINPRVAKIKAPSSPIKGDANILIFPDIPSANIAIKFVDEVVETKTIGSVAWGMKKPIVNGGKGFNARQIADIIALCAMQYGL